MNIAIDSKIIKNLSPEGQDALQQHLIKRAEKIVKEASRLESNVSGGGTFPEITAAFINAASENRYNIYNKKSSKSIIVKVVSPLSILLTGLMFNLEKFNESIWLILVFCFFLLIAGVSTTLSFVWEEK